MQRGLGLEVESVSPSAAMRSLQAEEDFGSTFMSSLVDLDQEPRPSSTGTESFGFVEQPGNPSGTCHWAEDRNGNKTQTETTTPGPEEILDCGGCGSPIYDRFLLKVERGSAWHEGCLSCSMCGKSLAGEESCYSKDGQLYCKTDYKNVYSSKCGRCFLPVSASDMVQKCFSAVYHVNCFSCFYCGQLLRKGDTFSVIEGQLVCSHDYEMMLASNFGEGGRKQPKRPRTILTSTQRRAFKASFEQSPKPCRKVRETLAKETGLSVRVVQVWFQNQRAKMKKIQRKAELQKLQEARKKGVERKAASSSSDASSDKPILSPDDGLSHSSEDEEETTPIHRLYSMQESYFY